MGKTSENSCTENQEYLACLDPEDYADILKKARSRFKELVPESVKIVTEAQRVQSLTEEEARGWSIKLTAAIANLQINGVLK